MMAELTQWIDVQYNSATADHDYQSRPITTEMIDFCCATLPVNSRIAVLDKLAV